jgi:hypothetical protein
MLKLKSQMLLDGFKMRYDNFGVLD